MRKFSERYGYRPVQEILQVESMSVELRTGLWNALQVCIWDASGFRYRQHGKPSIDGFSIRLWAFYFKRPVDTRPMRNGQLDVERTMRFIREYFFECEWHDVYSFLEFVVQQPGLPINNLADILNTALKEEMAGYQFIDQLVTPITSQAEVGEVEAALQDTKFAGVDKHLKRSLELLSDRRNPDYRNSIKEAISAVEAMARQITGNPKASLGDALSTLSRDGNLHGGLKAGFSSLYGYTSDEGGIRHGMLTEPHLTQADARYFLVSCSAFVNYLKASAV